MLDWITPQSQHNNTRSLARLLSHCLVLCLRFTRWPLRMLVLLSLLLKRLFFKRFRSYEARRDRVSPLRDLDSSSWGLLLPQEDLQRSSEPSTSIASTSILLASPCAESNATALRHQASVLHSIVSLSATLTVASDDVEACLPIPPPGLSASSPGFKPITASGFQRYQKITILERVPNRAYVIKAGTISFNRSQELRGWIPAVHPDGALYFVRESDTVGSLVPSRKILTDADLYNHEVLCVVETYLDQIADYFKSYSIDFPNDADLVLDLRQDSNNGHECGYYFADHGSRCIFWLDDYDAIDILAAVQVELNLEHVGLEIQSQYWRHCEMFPHTCTVASDVVSSLRDSIIHGIGDVLTSECSMLLMSKAPFDLHDLQRMLSLVDDLRDPEVSCSPGPACILFRLLSIFAHEQFLNLHGQQGARLRRLQSIHGDHQRRRSLLFRLIDPLLFFAPRIHLRKLEKLSVDQLVKKPSLLRIRAAMSDEWKEFTLYASVLLNANVAFLAIQGADTSGNHARRSNAQKASYFSTICSISAIILGLWLVRRHQGRMKVVFLWNRSCSALGLQTLAAWYSLPSALFFWAMFSFCAAFSLMCFDTTDIFTKALMGAAWAALGLLCAWCISIMLEKGPYLAPDTFWLWKALKKAALWTVKSHRLARRGAQPNFPSSPNSIATIA